MWDVKKYLSLYINFGCVYIKFKNVFSNFLRTSTDRKYTNTPQLSVPYIKKHFLLSIFKDDFLPLAGTHCWKSISVFKISLDWKLRSVEERRYGIMGVTVSLPAKFFSETIWVSWHWTVSVFQSSVLCYTAFCFSLAHISFTCSIWGPFYSVVSI